MNNTSFQNQKNDFAMNMADNEKYMRRCLQIAANAKGYTSPNPMVGAVIVHDDKIIGEGYHRKYGEAHAEVNAINSVKDKSLLKESTIYVSLEPCSHYGKTPPCSQLIIDSKIPKVVVAIEDPYPAVSGRGIDMLRNAGIEVEVGLLKEEAQELNKEFFTYNIKKRPYVYLKWAQTSDGFMDKIRSKEDFNHPTIISNALTQILVHKLRAHTSAIIVATNTAVNDNPSLTTRLWFGKNPIRFVLDRNCRVPLNYKLFNKEVNTYVFTDRVEKTMLDNNVTYLSLSFDQNVIDSLLKQIYDLKIDSIMVEGGAQFLKSFIKQGLWDEAFIEISDQNFLDGVKAPVIDAKVLSSRYVISSVCLHLKKD